MAKYDRTVRGSRNPAETAPRSNVPVSLFRILFPPPRKPLTLMSAVPMIAFLFCYLLFILALEWTDTVLFTTPIAFAFMVAAPWFWYMIAAGHCGLTGYRATAAMLVRLFFLGFVVALLAEPRNVQTSEKLTVVWTRDVSPSIPEANRDQATQYMVQTSIGKPETDESGEVVFARYPAVEHVPSMVPPSIDEVNEVATQVNKEGTNIAEALLLSIAMIPDGSQGRIILYSDGVGTEGDLESVLDELKSRGIPVDILPAMYTYENEVWVERLELPRFVKEGETYEASVIVSSINKVKGKLVLQENGRPVVEQEVEISPGKNRFSLPITLNQAGYYEYRANIEVDPQDDKITVNNNAASFLFLEGKGSVLIVKGPNDLDWLALRQALIKGQRLVEEVAAVDLPRDPLALLPYDCVIFANVAQDEFDKMQLQAVHDAVQNQGMGFLMLGGENSYGPGGYRSTVIEDLLPVTMDIKQRKVLPKGALAIILHTCEFANGNTWAKEITKQAIKVLSPQDDAGVLAYDWNGGDKWIVPLMPVSKYDLMVPKINNIQIGDMPTFGPTMQLAINGLRNSDASSKHMIIISDGDPQAPSPALLQSFVDNKISVSTVSIFPHNSTAVMQGIARATGGRHYGPFNNPGDEKKLPKIFIKEARTLKRSMIQEMKDGFVPDNPFPSPILKGIEAMPPLFGYVITTPKGGTSQTILQVPAVEDKDPLLARWNYGLGKTAAFTSDLSPRWAEQWLGWEQYEAFVKQLITDISRVRRTGNLRVQTFAAGTEGQIIVEDFAEVASFLELTAKVNGPDDKEMTLQLEQTGPRRYEAKFPLWGVGRYQVTASSLRKGESADPEENEEGFVDPEADDKRGTTERVHGGFEVPYSQEYMRFRADPNTLERIREATGGRELTWDPVADKVYDIEREKRQTTLPLVDSLWLWVILTSLMVFDVACRRVQMDWSMVAGWFSTRRQSSESTFESLRRAKTTVSGAMDRQREQQRDKPGAAPQRAAMDDVQLSANDAAKLSTPRPQMPKAQQSQQDEGSTTERLLALKRKQREEEERHKGDQ